LTVVSQLDDGPKADPTVRRSVDRAFFPDSRLAL
jgi:hypothetical protein